MSQSVVVPEQECQSQHWSRNLDFLAIGPALLNTEGLTSAMF